MQRTHLRLLAVSGCCVALVTVPNLADAAVPVPYGMADRPDITPATGARLVLPDSEVTAQLPHRPGPWRAIRSLFRSDDAPDAVAPSPRRDLPQRAFAHDRRLTGSIGGDR